MALRDGVGNPLARAALLRALGCSRLPHALLLHGPKGVGKRATAMALAQALLCPLASPDACGTCNVCRRAAEGLHPDLMVVERDGQFIKIETARELVRSSFLRPYEGRAKVFVLPEAERLHEESANTLLKTLEEPPQSTYILLVTSRREAVLPTVRSRCAAIAFQPLSRAELKRLRLGDESESEADADLRSRLAEGSDARAQELDLDLLRESRREALEMLQALAQGALPIATADRLIELTDGVAGRDGQTDRFLDLLRGLARDAMVLAAGGDPEVLIHHDLRPALEDLGVTLGLGGAMALLADLDRAQQDLTVNANKKLLLQAVLLGVYTRTRTARSAVSRR